MLALVAGTVFSTFAVVCQAAVYDGYSTTTGADPCTIGPNTWCQSTAAQQRCDVGNQAIGVCGYNTTRCPEQSVTAFCSNTTTLAANMTQLKFNGGLSGARGGDFGYYALSLYWPPSTCNATIVSNNSFCSQYTLAGNEAANHLVAHGLWPDFGSIYDTAPVGPSYSGSYQGWSQFCNGPDSMAYQCHVNGNLCPWANATAASFTQDSYEACMVANNISQCIISTDVVAQLGDQFKRYAPGYWSQPGSFINHEFFKHGSCVGGYLARNQTAFFEQVVNVTANNTAPGTVAYNMVHNNRGRTVSRTSLESAFYPTAVPQCQRSCNLDSVTYCIGRDAAGFPTELVQCPSGTLSSANCATYGCNTINIPAYPGQAAAPGVAPSGTPAFMAPQAAMSSQAGPQASTAGAGTATAPSVMSSSISG
ncbi:hypothetical protein WJX74_004599 [Apatococcus lobatus]|uniref:Uncharacterized protein n=1 Tax=Apatococcus lobatus TaxID=904363 RepID=A0AAW1RYP8_9CHLO